MRTTIFIALLLVSMQAEARSEAQVHRAPDRYYTIFPTYCSGPHPYWLALQAPRLFPETAIRVLPAQDPEAQRLCKGDVQ